MLPSVRRNVNVLIEAGDSIPGNKLTVIIDELYFVMITRD